MSGSVMKVVCLALSGRTIVFGAFVPGALPQAMLCQSFGLKIALAVGWGYLSPTNLSAEISPPPYRRLLLPRVV